MLFCTHSHKPTCHLLCGDSSGSGLSIQQYSVIARPDPLPLDLNPVRAAMAETPESSEYTSIKARIAVPEIAEKLLPFLTTANDYKINRPDSVLPFGWADYLELVDWTGRAIRKDKRGSIPANLPSIFSRLNMDAHQWLKQHRMLESHYPCFMGQWRQMKSACEQLKRNWSKGIHSSRLLFGT